MEFVLEWTWIEIVSHAGKIKFERERMVIFHENRKKTKKKTYLSENHFLLLDWRNKIEKCQTILSNRQINSISKNHK